MLYTKDIQRFIEKYFGSYVYVGARDMLPRPGQILDRPVAYIINTHSSDREGEHWFLIYVPKFGPCEFFDSFGREPNLRFKSFLTCHSNYVFNSKCVQSLQSSTCGMHCLYYLYNRIKGESIFHILNYMYYSDSFLNDAIVTKFYNLLK